MRHVSDKVLPRLNLALLALCLGAPLSIHGRDSVPHGHAGDLEQLQGVWQAEVRTPVQTKMTVTMTIDGDRVTWKAKHLVTRTDQISSARLAIDETQTPRHWDMTNFWAGSDGPRLPNMRAVYCLDGDELTLCVPPNPGSPRPTEIVPDRGQWPLCTVVFRRVK